MSARTELERRANEATVDLAVFLAHFERSLSSIVSELRGMTVNDVLDAELVVLDASGIWSRDWSVPFAAVAVANGGPALVLASDPPQQSAPTGPGSHPVGAGAAVVVNITGRTLTLYGTAGTIVGLQVFTRPQPPSFGTATTGAVRFAESTTPLLAAGTVNGGTYATAGYAHFRAFASSDVAGTVAIQQSRDGLTWYTTTSQAVAADSTSGTVIESIVTLPFARARYVNGAANQAAFELDSALLAA